MFYNTENFFDVFNDSLKDDDEFLPEGVMRWNMVRFNKKVNSITKTIIAAGEWQAPAVVAFCEIENREVLEKIIYGQSLLKYNYHIVHEESPDPRGIDVCMIYRSDIIKIIDYSYWIPQLNKDEIYTSRSVLYAKLGIGTDTVNLIINHWPSRRGGVLAAETLRKRIAEMVRSKVDSINRHYNGSSKTILMGDFNSAPDDPVIKVLTNVIDNCNNLINLSSFLAETGDGTYRYQGSWEIIDQVIVSESVLENRIGLYTTGKSVKIFAPDFLMMKDPNYPGLVPKPTYRGYRYQGGFSDHLPVLIDLLVR